MHMTGSSQLIQILNGFGHSTSHSSTLEHNTASAHCQLSLEELADPKGIKDGKFTTLVWDNINFGGETLPGKGTTHSTNGSLSNELTRLIPKCENMRQQRQSRKPNKGTSKFGQ